MSVTRGTPRGFRTGDMRNVIAVKVATQSIDASRQLVVTYNTNRYPNEPASFHQVSGGEYFRGRQVEAGVTAVFTVNYRPNYDETDRIVCQGGNYGIVRIHKPEGVARYLELYCKATP